MRARRTARSALAASIAALALPGAAGAEYLVPPGNSAATQYTEALPTAGGHLDAEKSRPNRDRAPSEVLGEKKTRELEAHGDTGREVAEFTAESAPTPDATPADRSEYRDGPSGIATHKTEGERQDRDEVSIVANEDAGPGGSSGLGEVVSRATGVSSGELGLLPPLAILGTTAWALAFLLRRRQRSTA